jgi:hypothetical protein
VASAAIMAGALLCAAGRVAGLPRGV